MTDINALSSSTSGRVLWIALWIVQILLAVPFTAFGIMKMTMPLHDLAGMMPWAEQVPSFVVRVTGLIDAAGGLGLVLPALTRIKPELTKFAALGVVVLQLSAIIFHVSRGEAANTPLNVVFLALAAFVLWGRTSRAPITAR